MTEPKETSFEVHDPEILANARAILDSSESPGAWAEANVITNKNLIPTDGPEDWDRPSGLRIGTIEVTRLGMREAEMATIADFITRVLIEGESTESVGQDVIDFRLPQQTFYYNFDHGLPLWAN